MGPGFPSRDYLHVSRCQTFPYHQEVNQLSSLFLPSGTCCYLLLFLLILLPCPDSVAQTPNSVNPRLLHGSIFTAQGQPAAEATVEIRDLRGIKVRSGVTDSAGKFEIRGAAEPGEYIFLAMSAFQIKDERLLLDRQDLEMSLALPVISETVGPKPSPETVSVGQLSIPTKARAHLSSAHAEFSRMNLHGGLAGEIDAALQIDPVCAQAFSMRAFVKLAARDLLGAAEDAQRAIFLDANDAESYLALGTAYNSLKEFPKAETTVRQALSLTPDSWQGQLEMAKSLYGQGQFVLALRELDAMGRGFSRCAFSSQGNVLIRL